MHGRITCPFRHMYMQGAYNNKSPRKDNEATVKGCALAQRLYGAHRGTPASSSICYFGLAVTCASVLNGGDAAAKRRAPSSE